MTKAEHAQKAKPAPNQRPERGRRLLTWAIVAACTFAAALAMFDRSDLPARVRNNAYVEKIYRERDAAISMTEAAFGHHKTAEAPDANADMKQQGYPKDDRAKLDNIINNSGSSP